MRKLLAIACLFLFVPFASGQVFVNGAPTSPLPVPVVVGNILTFNDGSGNGTIIWDPNEGLFSLSYGGGGTIVGTGGYSVTSGLAYPYSVLHASALIFGPGTDNYDVGFGVDRTYEPWYPAIFGGPDFDSYVFQSLAAGGFWRGQARGNNTTQGFFVSGMNADASKTSNQQGGDVRISGGLGSRRYNVVNYTGLTGATVTITINGTPRTVTEGSDWFKGSSNAEAGTSLSEALNSAGRAAGDLASTTYGNGDALIWADPKVYSLVLTKSVSDAYMTATHGTDGVVSVVGGLTSVITVRDSGGTANCTITVTGGIITATTCSHT